MPQRPWASGSSRPGSTGRGPNGTVGRSRRAARARLTNSATRSGSLGGRPAGAGAARRRSRCRRRWRGSSSSASADVAGVRPPARIDRDPAGDRGRERRSTARRPVPPSADGSAVSRRMASRFGLRAVARRPRRRRGSVAGRRRRPRSVGRGRWSDLHHRQRDPIEVAGGSAPWSCTASRPEPRGDRRDLVRGRGRRRRRRSRTGARRGASRGQQRRAPPPRPPRARAACPGRG